MNRKALTWPLNFVSVLCASIVIWQFMHKGDSDFRKEPDEVKVGSHLRLPGASLGSHPLTVVLGLSAYSQYCRSSAGFYRTLTRASNAAGVPTVAVLKEGHDAVQPFVASLGIEEVKDIREGDLVKLGIPSTPTLLIVDSGGTIQNLWRGKLSRPQEKQVLSIAGLSEVSLQGPSGTIPSERDGSNTVSSTELIALLKDANTVVLDTRERSEFRKAHITGSLNIPYDEVVARGRHELPQDRPIVMFCNFCPSCEAPSQSDGTLSSCALSDQVLQWANLRAIRHISDDLATLAEKGVPTSGSNVKK